MGASLGGASRALRYDARQLRDCPFQILILDVQGESSKRLHRLVDLNTRSYPSRNFTFARVAVEDVLGCQQGISSPLSMGLDDALGDFPKRIRVVSVTLLSRCHHNRRNRHTYTIDNKKKWRLTSRSAQISQGDMRSRESLKHHESNEDRGNRRQSRRPSVRAGSERNQRIGGSGSGVYQVRKEQDTPEGPRSWSQSKTIRTTSTRR